MTLTGRDAEIIARIKALEAEGGKDGIRTGAPSA
jgi:hypothetical protein